MVPGRARIRWIMVEGARVGDACAICWAMYIFSSEIPKRFLALNLI